MPKEQEVKNNDEDKPKGKVKIYASFGPMCWRTDDNGLVWQRWGFEKWERPKEDD